MSKYNVGDKVRIVDEPVDGKCYCWLSEMDKWRGRAMTIDQVLLWGYGMKEMSDIGWDEKMIAGLAIPNAELLQVPEEYRQYAKKSLIGVAPSLDLDVDLKKPEKKYNVIAIKEISQKYQTRYWFRGVFGGLATCDDSGNNDADQQWTDAQIKEYGLEDYEKIEVADDEV